MYKLRLKNGYGVVLANSEEAVVVNGMLVNENLCISLSKYDGYSNRANHNLDITKVFEHLADKWQQVENGYIYGLLKGISKSKQLFDHTDYVVKTIDNSMLYQIGDEAFKCNSLQEAEELYGKIISDIKNKFGWLMLSAESLGYKCAIFVPDKKKIESNEFIPEIKVIMRQGR